MKAVQGAIVGIFIAAFSSGFSFAQGRNQNCSDLADCVAIANQAGDRAMENAEKRHAPGLWTSFFRRAYMDALAWCIWEHRGQTTGHYGKCDKGLRCAPWVGADGHAFGGALCCRPGESIKRGQCGQTTAQENAMFYCLRTGPNRWTANKTEPCRPIGMCEDVDPNAERYVCVHVFDGVKACCNSSDTCYEGDLKCVTSSNWGCNKTPGCK